MTPRPEQRADAENQLMELAHKISDIGEEIGLPYVAISADISDPEPVLDTDNKPMAETIFRWLGPNLAYWKDRAFALRAGVIRSARNTAEPFYVKDGKSGTWRYSETVENFDLGVSSENYGVRTSIVCPCHLPFGIIGTIVWANDQLLDNIEEIFCKNAERMHIISLKFVALYNDLHSATRRDLEVDLTRREIQCLKWAAAGKTDSEIATIVGISAPTVRFHLNNASRKFGVTGRGQAIHHATRLGYVGRMS